ncbi:30S ribosomal protein S20 [bacterium]|nr:30S ribosomal protein S20 [bacterium]
MATHKSAEKRARQNIKIRERHRILKGHIRSLIKQIQIEKDTDKMKLLLNQLNSALDKSVKKGIYHKNTAARHKSRIARLIQEKTKTQA